jgi:hypothetical protein
MSRLQEIVGTEIVNDIRLGHTWKEYEVLKQFIFDRQPAWFVEVGIHEGGLPYLLLPLLGDIRYFGIELDCRIIRPEVRKMFEFYENAYYMCDDCFSETVFDSVGALGNKIIYCDGGNKVEELKHFKNLCKPHDIILSHDFWDGDRKVDSVEEPHPEVLPMDVVHLDLDETFVRVNEYIHNFDVTRIVGWRKI